jgi:hypothetical protein
MSILISCKNNAISLYNGMWTFSVSHFSHSGYHEDDYIKTWANTTISFVRCTSQTVGVLK